MAAAKYYQDQLGFEIHFVWGEPAEYVVTNREDSVGIHFVKQQDGFQPSQAHISLYIFVYDVDRLYLELKAKEVEIVNPIGTREWGMRDFDIKDPNGYLLSFGTHVDRLTD
jgi:uncharacterized glyoxalase superfamily protein PhnB